jgi:hypothetical protein
VDAVLETEAIDYSSATEGYIRGKETEIDGKL